MPENITISLEEYKDLIRSKQKAEQYKKYFLENTQNNLLNKIMCTIECKNLFELIKEEQNKEENKNG